MGIFDFLRKKEKKDARTAQKDALEEINSLINELNQKLKEQITVLENIDFSKYKTEERVRIIVKNSLKDFIKHVNSFSEQINNIEENTLKNFYDRIKEEVSEFQKRSFKSQEKSRFLVGKELADTLNSIGQFSKKVQEIIKNNQNVIEFNEKSKLTDNLRKEKIFMEKEKKEIKEKIKQIKEKDKISKDNINRLAKEKESIKKSEKYQKELKKRKELEQKQKDLKLTINKLKGEIDFKDLANRFHSNKKDMQIIKEYKNNFYERFMKDLGKDISGLADLDNGKIQSLHKEILALSKAIDISGQKKQVEHVEAQIKLNQDNLEENKGLIAKLKSKKQEINNKINNVDKRLKNLELNS